MFHALLICVAARGRIGWKTGSSSDNGIRRAELHYLSPSSSAWPFGNNYYGSLQMNKIDYHAHYIIHEITHLWQIGMEYATGYDPPSWIWEGIAEYEGYLKSTEWNRDEGIDRFLAATREKDVKREIHCCYTLAADRLVISTTKVYYGGGLIMLFFAEHFGEPFLSELFLQPLEVVLYNRGTNVIETFLELLIWYRNLDVGCGPKKADPGWWCRLPE